MFHEEMTIEDGLLLKGTCIIIPQTLHKEMIPASTCWTPWIGKMPKQSKAVHVLASLYDELKDLITNCTTCLNPAPRSLHLTNSMQDMKFLSTHGQNLH